MKKFLIESALFSLILTTSFYFVFIKADGYTDPFYIRFTTPKQTSLILGSSRAAQGIKPSTINEVLSRNDLFNYSFTIGHSPYGPVYLKSIKRKLDKESKEGIFILAVDPWSVSSKSDNPNDIQQFKELDLFLAKTTIVDLNPNWIYLSTSYDKPFFNLLLKKKSSTFLHDDGWLEVNMKLDSAGVKKRIERKVAHYKKNNLPYYNYSSVRLEYLIKTIEYLKPHGKVFLVRLPVHPLMMEIDQQVIPEFDDKIRSVSVETNTPYLDLTYLNSQISFTDGNHIYKTDGEKISIEIGKWILKQD